MDTIFLTGDVLILLMDTTSAGGGQASSKPSLIRWAGRDSKNDLVFRLRGHKSEMVSLLVSVSLFLYIFFYRK